MVLEVELVNTCEVLTLELLLGLDEYKEVDIFSPMRDVFLAERVEEVSRRFERRRCEAGLSMLRRLEFLRWEAESSTSRRLDRRRWEAGVLTLERRALEGGREGEGAGEEEGRELPTMGVARMRPAEKLL